MGWHMTHAIFADARECFEQFARKDAFGEDFELGLLRQVDIAHEPDAVYLAALDADNTKYLFVRLIECHAVLWGYKMMDANIGPRVSNCPARLLDWFEANNPVISSFGHAFIARNREAQALSV